MFRWVLLTLTVLFVLAAGRVAGLPQFYKEKSGPLIEEMDNEFLRYESERADNDYRTYRDKWIDNLAGLAALCGTLFVGGLWLRVGKWSDWSQTQTPRDKGSVYLMFNLALVIIFFAASFQLALKADRGDFHPHADTIILGIISMFLFIAFSSFFTNLLTVVVLHRVDLPVRLLLFAWPLDLIGILIEIINIAVLIFGTTLLIGMIYYGYYLSVPWGLVVFYWWLTLHAVFVARRMKTCAVTLAGSD